ncbi:MAG: PAS domain S-box protein [Chitinivibrionales bacterium]|nr:PAS domain S-box protein [Chitinivibrionales bacterium]
MRLLYANPAALKLVVEAGNRIGDKIPAQWHSLVESLSTEEKQNSVDVTLGERVYSFVAMPIPDRGYVNIYATDITERKQAEVELRENENQLRIRNEELVAAKEKAERNEKELKRTQEITHVGSWYLDTATNQVVWSEELYRMYGFDPSLPVPPYTEHMKLFTAESWDILSSSLANTRETGVPYELELEMVRKDGSNGWMWVRGEAVLDSEKKIIGLWGAAQDITERRKLQDALLESEALLDRTGQMARVGGWELDPATNEVTWTKETYRIHEVPFDDKPPLENALEFWHPDDRPILANAIKKALAEGKPYDLELRFITAKGRHLVARTIGKPILENNEVVRLQGSFQDITERKEAEQTLAEEKERLAVTLRSIGDGVITTDVEGNVTMLNKAAEQMTGWNSEAATGRPLMDVFNIVDEDTRQKRENPVEKVLRTGQTVDLANHTCLIGKNGREVVIGDSGAPILDRESNIIGVILVFRDITDKQKLDESMQRAQRLESLGALAGGIAHDFNNLLGGIFGNIDLALEGIGDGEHVRRYLGRGIGALERAKDLTQQLLTFSKGGAPRKKPVDISRVLEQSQHLSLSGSSIDCSINIAPETSTIEADENQLCQVFNNVMINARQALLTFSAVAETFPATSARPFIYRNIYTALCGYNKFNSFPFTNQILSIAFGIEH